MPIYTSVPIVVFDQEEFHAIDKVVTGMAYQVHNELGRYLDEVLYQVAMEQSMLAHGFSVVREMKMTLTLETFSKDFYADFILNQGVIVETKTVDTLTSAHKAHVLNYLYASGLHHASLINLRADRVQRVFVSTTYTREERQQITCDTIKWEPITQGCEILKSTLELALRDWGSRLDPSIYRDVITHFLGGVSCVVKEVEVCSNHGILGHQKVHMLSDDVAFSITTAVRHPELFLEHQQRFLQHTRLRAIQWVNLNGQNITFHTIKQPNKDRT
jgi:GxxExxY protein